MPLFSSLFRSRLTAGLLAATLSFGAGCANLPAGERAGPDAEAARAALSFATAGQFLLGFAETLVKGIFTSAVNSAIFGDPVDYARIDAMIKADLVQFGRDEKVSRAADHIVSAIGSLRTITKGFETAVGGASPTSLNTLSELWRTLNDDLASVSRDEAIRRQGFPTYLFGATIQHGVFQQLIAMDPAHELEYAGQLRDALVQHIDYVSAQVAHLERLHAARTAKVVGWDPRYSPPRDAGDCEMGFLDPNRYYYYDTGAEGGADPYLPTEADHPEDPHAGGSPHDYGEGPWSLKSGDGAVYRRAWELYNASPSAERRCSIARANYTRDLALKLETADHLQEARALLQQWGASLEEVQRRLLQPIVPK